MNSPTCASQTQGTRPASLAGGMMHKLTRVCAPVAALTLLTAHSVSALAQEDIANVPLSVVSGADPNIMFILDDSGSMQREVTPEVFWVARTFPVLADDLFGGSDTQETVAWPFADEGQTLDARATAIRFRSVAANASYYDPSVTYIPWVAADGTPFPNADPEAALHNPARPEKGARNLTVEQSDFATYTVVNDNSQLVVAGTGTASYFPARYYQFNGAEGDDLTDPDNYTEVLIQNNGQGDAVFIGHGRENRTDCSLPNACTYAEEIQNFANWYTYYRARLLAAQATIGIAFNDLPEDVRVGFGTINHSGSVDGVNGNAVAEGVRAFDTQNRDIFYDQLYNRAFSNRGTPLRTALRGAGTYFERADDRGPWSDSPGESGNTDFLSCRKSFTILMTDGFWNGGSPGVGNVDGTVGNSITGPDNQSFTYNPEGPFTDDFGNTLADVAMHYWNRDLLPNTENRVPTNDRNPAFWQHMVTFGVAFGVEGNIDPEQAFAAIGGDETTEIEWQDPTSSGDSDPSKIDDLLHAAINGRGGFFSAAEPTAFQQELSSVLSEIIDRSSTSGTSAATSSSILTAEARRFVASFEGENWSGDLRSQNIESNNLIWSATAVLSEAVFDNDRPSEVLIPNLGARTLLTYNGNQGIDLEFAELTQDQQEALNTNLDGSDGSLNLMGPRRLQWLQGSEVADTGLTTDFRSREFNPGGSPIARLIGDIVNSNPQIERKRNFGFGSLGGTLGSSYLTYRASNTYQNRPNTVYVGANDGYLHAFRADTGDELFAYMPSELLEAEPGGDGFAPVNRLMDPNYQHRFFVDGTPIISDAHINGQWRTLLVGSMGVGGRTVFALDITTPQNPSADTTVLWEFTDEDLQRGVSEVQIGRLNTGDWAAIFGSGLEGNGEGDGHLFIVDLATGQLIRKIRTPDSLGLSTPTPTIINNVVNEVYAGSMSGGMWRFDLTATQKNQWGVEKLFQAEDPSGEAQPITARPRVSRHPTDQNLRVISFGTGAFFRESDRNSTQIQTLYGIFDEMANSRNISRGDLLEQIIQSETSRSVNVTREDGTSAPFTFQIREVSNFDTTEQQDGWLLDLHFNDSENPNAPLTGERMVSPATFPSGADRSRVRFSTLVPSSGACSSGVSGWLMELSTATGGRLEEPSFDLERDGVFDLGVSGIRNALTGEELSTIFKDGVDKIVNSTGNEPKPDLRAGEGPGRQSWEQIQ